MAPATEAESLLPRLGRVVSPDPSPAVAPLQERCQAAAADPERATHRVRVRGVGPMLIRLGGAMNGNWVGTVSWGARETQAL